MAERIGIDARELAGRPTGVGRYLAALLREWSAAAALGRLSTRFVLYSPVPLDETIVRDLAPLSPEYRVLPGAGGTWWEQVTLAGAVRADAPDVFFAPAYTAPLRVRCPVVVTVHDLSYMARPEWFRPRERWRRALITKASVRRAAAILTDSAFSAGEVVRLTGVAPGSVTVVPLGLGLTGSVPLAPSPREPLVLYVGSIFNRRRVPDLLEAFARVAAARPEARLELVGENRTWPAQDIQAIAAAPGLAGRVRVRDYVPDEALSALYARASVFVFLSEYEGFGLTPLEAMARGVPAVVLDTPVAREIYEGSAVYVAAGDIAGTAAAIERLLGDEGARVPLLAEAARLLPRYSWRDAAERTLAVLAHAAR